MHLALKPAKTQFVSLEQGFTFLGFSIGIRGVKIQQNRIERIKNMLLPLMKCLGKSDSTLARRAEAMMRINACIRGFRNYFFLQDEKQIQHQLLLLDRNIEQSDRFHLPAKNTKRPGFGVPGTLLERRTRC